MRSYEQNSVNVEIVLRKVRPPGSTTNLGRELRRVDTDDDRMSAHCLRADFSQNPCSMLNASVTVCLAHLEDVERFAG